MPAYRYRALDPDRVRFASTIEADSLDAAVDLLSERGFSIESIELDDGRESSQDPYAEAGAGSQPRLEPAADRPPAAPRDVDRKSITAPGGNVLLLVGAIFAIVGLVFVVTGVAMLLGGNNAGWAIAGFPLIHLSVGVGMLYYSLSRRAERRRIAELGEVAVATITSTGFDRKVRINGRNPYKMTFDFRVGDVEHSGKRSTMNSDITEHELFDRIWVLYDPADPSKNMEWPPV